MAIIGSILKRTARIGNQIGEKKRFDYSLQTKVLHKLLDKAKFTELGTHYDFKEILLNPNPIEEYAKRLPIFDYTQFHTHWLYRVLQGEKDVIWPGKTSYFALSSGTSGATSKRIPVSESMIRNFQRVSMTQTLTLHDYDLPTNFYEKSILIIGGSTQLKEFEEYKEGDLSGILAGKIPLWFSNFSKPGKKISKIANWDDKLDAIVKEAPKWDIGIISGIPAWVEMVLKAIINTYKLSSIHEIWPSLKVYVHGGVSIEPYRSELHKLFAEPVYFQETYLASEGYFAYQKSDKRTGMRLLLNAGVYFEFIPFNEQNFDANGTLSSNAQALPLHQVKENTEYALVVSTCSGLWRYLIGDTIRFTSMLDYEIKITGRISHFMSTCGEHLSIENMDQAIKATAEILGIQIQEYTLYALKNGKHKHHWYLGTDKILNDTLVAKVLDQELKKINDDYASLRKHVIDLPTVNVIPNSFFLNFLAQKGKIGGQNKFPRALKGTQLDEWKLFLQR